MANPEDKDKLAELTRQIDEKDVQIKQLEKEKQELMALYCQLYYGAKS